MKKTLGTMAVAATVVLLTATFSFAEYAAAGLGNFNYVDLDPHIDPEKEPFKGGPEFNAPLYRVSDEQPGLGIKRR